MSCFSGMFEEPFSREEIEDAARNARLLTMEIEFSRRCNFRCPYCYAEEGAGRGGEEMAPERIREAIVQARDLGARRIVVLGGEPMVYPRIMDMLGFIREQGLDAEMFTNGTNITPEAAASLFRMGVQVVLKMNSFEPDVQDRLTGIRGGHATIRAAFRNLRAAGYPAEHTPMAVSTVICKANVGEIPRLWTWLRDQGIAPYFETVTPQGRAVGKDDLALDPAEARRVFEALADLDRERYGHAWTPQPPLVGNRCLRHQYSCLVTATGDVMPCVGVTIPVGNLRDRPLAEILRDSEVMQDLRQYRRTIRGPCADCAAADACYGCRGAAYHLTGDYLASDPMCWRNEDCQADIRRLPMPVDSLLPHLPPIRLVDRLLEVGERTATVEAELRKDSPWIRPDGTLDPAAHVELIAQSAAAMNGFRAGGRNGAGDSGYLLGARSVRVRAPARVGDALTVRVFKAARYGPFGMVEGWVRRGDTLLAHGEIKVWDAASADSGEDAPGSGRAPGLGSRVASLLAATLAAGVMAAGPVRAESAAPAASEAALQALEAAVGEVRTVQTAFVQEKHVAALRQPVRIRGTLAVEHPDRLAWRVTDPIRYTLVVRGARLRQWDEDTDSVQQVSLRGNPVFDVVTRQLQAWLGGRFDELSESFAVEMVSEDPLIVAFVPREDSFAHGMVRRVRVTFTGDRRYAQEFLIEESGGDRTRMVFHDTVLNEPIDPGAWEVRPVGR